MKVRLLIFSIFFLVLNPMGKAEGQGTGDSLLNIWTNEVNPDTLRLAAARQLIVNDLIANDEPDTVVLYAMYNLAKRSRNEKYKYLTSYFLAIYYSNKESLSEALQYGKEALGYATQSNSSARLSDCYSILATIAYDIQDFDKMLEYQKLCLKYEKEGDDLYSIAHALHNLGYTYQELGEYQKAIENYNECIKFSEQNKLELTKANALGYLGETYQLMGEYVKAQEYFEKSLNLRKQLNISREIGWTKAKMGEGYVLLKDYSKAAFLCKDALKISESRFNHDAIRVSCKCLYEAYKGLGRYKEALGYYERWNLMKDSLKKSETIRALQSMDFDREMLRDSLEQEKEKAILKEAYQIDIQKKNKTRNVLLALTSLGLLLTIGFFSRLRYVKKSRDIISKEKERSESLLLNILPAEIAQELKEKGEAKARDFEMVSILFSDFKEFTSTSEKLSAQDLVAEINANFKAFDNIMEKYGIEKIKTIGDAYMAAGGLPIPNADSVKNTVLAALEMQEFIMKRKAEKDEKGEEAFEMRLGIHTGPVVAGIVGVKKFQYDVWGDTVNTASRIESSSKVGKVNISQATYASIKNESEFNFEARGKIAAKGKGEIEMWFVSPA